jgi:hypothetical protein
MPYRKLSRLVLTSTQSSRTGGTSSSLCLQETSTSHSPPKLGCRTTDNPQISWQATDVTHAPAMSNARLNILRLLISHRDISLYTLNASQFSMRRVSATSPLGAAVLLNMPLVVKDLLELCIGMVSVDFPDNYGGTPLMCKIKLYLPLCLSSSS